MAIDDGCLFGGGSGFLEAAKIEIGGTAFLGLVVVCARDAQGNAVFAALLWIIGIFASTPDFASSASVTALRLPFPLRLSTVRDRR
jgi:hypothetical protein